jgi:RND family efflux transporter MFP subunit
MLYSCSSPDPGAQIERYKNQIQDLEQKIAELEASQPSEAEEEEVRAQIPVEVALLEPQPFARYFQVRGSLEAVQDAFISPEINGQIKEVLVERGDRVSRGSLLVRLNTEITEKSIEEVRTSLELATRLFEKQEELWEQEIGSEIQYLEAKNTKESLEARLATLEEQLNMAMIRAPFAGIVDDIPVKEGELASPGMPLVHLVNLDEVRVSAQVSEAFMSDVRLGDKVELSFSSFPDLRLEAPVSRIGEVINSQTRTFTVEVRLDNPGGKLKPNMLTSLRMKDFEEPEALVVPSIVIREDFNGTFLYLASGEGESYKAEKKYVERGMTVQDRTMITDGVEPGDRVIIKGFNLVSDGSPVRPVKN